MANEKIICQNCGKICDNDAYILLDDGTAYCCEDCAEESGLVRCDDCGAWIDESDAHHCDNGHIVCDNCIDDYCTCDDCGAVLPADCFTDVYNEYGRYLGVVCDDCLGDYSYCDECECYHTGYSYDATDASGRSVSICQNCYDNNYFRCDNCGGIFHIDLLASDDDCGEYLCEECAEECGRYIGRYHQRPALHFYGTRRKNWRLWYIGVELEIDRKSRDSSAESAAVRDIKDAAGDYVYFNRDGSLYCGFEIISQPATLEYFNKNTNWHEILHAARANGYTSHDAGTCGLHVHLSRELFGADKKTQDDNVAKLIRFYDVYYSEIVKAARRTGGTAERWAAPSYTSSNDDAKNAAKNCCAGRYHAVNVTNANTIEIRIMRGTLNAATFDACIDFVVHTAMNSKRIAWRDIDNASKWLHGLKDGTKEYLKARNAFILEEAHNG